MLQATSHPLLWIFRKHSTSGSIAQIESLNRRQSLQYLWNHTIQGRTICPGALMFEMSCAAGRLLLSSETLSNPVALTAAAIPTPMELSLGRDCITTSRTDCTSGRAEVQSAGSNPLRPLVHMTGRLATSAAVPAATSRLPVAVPRTPAAVALRPSAAAVAAHAGLRPALVLSALDLRHQDDSGYHVHPTATDACIHAGAALRAASDTGMMVSVALGFYGVQDPLRGPEGHVGVQLSSPAPDGTITSCHYLFGSNGAPALSMGDIQARPVAAGRAGPVASAQVAVAGKEAIQTRRPARASVSVERKPVESRPAGECLRKACSVQCCIEVRKI